MKTKIGDEVCLQGIIFKGIGGFYYIKAEDDLVYECKARGVFRKEKIKPMIGDRVEIEIIDESHGNISKIMPRTSELVRPPVSNIDLLVVVVATINPAPDFYFLDKLLVMAEARGIKPAICINKTDISSACEIREIYKNTNYPIFEACAKDNRIPDELCDYLKGKTTAFAGLSGVGKSSLLNALLGEEISDVDVL